MGEAQIDKGYAGNVGAGLGSDLYRAGQSVERTAEQAAAFVKAYREAVK